MKPTIATVKAFIRNKRHFGLLFRSSSNFDPMTDCVQSTSDRSWGLARTAEYMSENNQGISGVWFVGRSRDYVNPIVDGNIQGFEVSNCCGKWAVGVRHE